MLCESCQRPISGGRSGTPLPRSAIVRRLLQLLRPAAARAPFGRAQPHGEAHSARRYL